MYAAGTIAFLAIIILLFKLPGNWLRRALWFDIIIDIIVTTLFISLLAGTYSGMMAALIAGLIFSICLWALKAWIGYERLRFKRNAPWLYWELIQ